MEGAEERISERLRNYLKRDGMGIRKAVLKLFLNDKSYTTEDVYTYLDKEGFDVSYRGVSAMVGLMNTRLGILSIDVSGDHNVYSLKSDHMEIVRTVLENY
jgi:Fe2+ or Zn2+ uptake regulation protein